MYFVKCFWQINTVALIKIKCFFGFFLIYFFIYFLPPVSTYIQMIPSFVPSNGPLVVRTGMGTVPENHRKSHNIPTTMKDFAGAKPNQGAKTRFGQLSQSSFFARHNPQPNRVRHIKGKTIYSVWFCGVQLCYTCRLLCLCMVHGRCCVDPGTQKSLYSKA